MRMAGISAQTIASIKHQPAFACGQTAATKAGLLGVPFSRQPLQNRVPGNACERRLRRIQRAGGWRSGRKNRGEAAARRFFRAPQERLRSNFEPFCPCHRKSLETAGFQGFFFALLRTAHGLLCRISMRKNGVNFASGGIRSQRFRLHHHQNSIKILAPAVFQPELSLFSAVQILPTRAAARVGISAYISKPSVMPFSLAVSFLT